MTDAPLCPRGPALTPTPLSLALTSSPRTEPPRSVWCSQNQQPRQCPFHHSGPQCYFNKLSQATGLKRRIPVGFALCKHTDACGWQVAARNTPFTYQPSQPMPAPKSGALTLSIGTHSAQRRRLLIYLQKQTV